MAAFGSVPKDEACDLKEIFTNYKIRKEGKKKKILGEGEKRIEENQIFSECVFFLI